MIKFNNFYKIIALLIIAFFMSSCIKLPKPDWSKPAEPDGKKRARENVKQGKGVIFDLNRRGKSGGDFLFASSNPLWRSSLETLDFMSLAVVDYAGGVVITDWYSENDPNEAVKISIKFLTNEIRADALKVDIFKRDCINTNSCSVKKIDSDLSLQIQKKILKKAAVYQKDLKEKRLKDGPKLMYPGDND